MASFSCLCYNFCQWRKKHKIFILFILNLFFNPKAYFSYADSEPSYISPGDFWPFKQLIERLNLISFKTTNSLGRKDALKLKSIMNILKSCPMTDKVMFKWSHVHIHNSEYELDSVHFHRKESTYWLITSAETVYLWPLNNQLIAQWEQQQEIKSWEICQIFSWTTLVTCHFNIWTNQWEGGIFVIEKIILNLLTCSKYVVFFQWTGVLVSTDQCHETPVWRILSHNPGSWICESAY